MYSLSTFCCVCLHDSEELESLTENDFDNVQLLSKLKFCALQTDEYVINDTALYICIQCCHILRLAYNFKKMCIKNNNFIKGYVSQLKNNLKNDGSTNISLQKFKDYVDNIPLSQSVITPAITPIVRRMSTPIVRHMSTPIGRRMSTPIGRRMSTRIRNRSQTKESVSEKQFPTKKAQKEVEFLQNSLEPEINIHESDMNIDIEAHSIITENKKLEMHPLTQNNDFQEKSSTQTLGLLKRLVHGTHSAAVDKLRELITEPIPDESNDEFHCSEKETDFEKTCVNPEPSEDDLEADDHHASGGESEDAFLKPGFENIQNLLRRDDNYCPICQKMFLCKSYYDRHITMHTGIKNYECDICRKRFTRKSTLKTHFLGHTGDPSFACPLCNKMFTQKGNMKIHLQGHHLTKQFQCLECYKSFEFEQDFKFHVASHEKSKKQKCPVCKKTIIKTYFKAHLTLHRELKIK